MVLLALLPSPLLGCAVWEPVASALRDLGWRAAAIDVTGPPPADAQNALQAYLHALPADDDLVLVPHSNAGLYAPAIADDRRVVAVAFVDASIPPIDGGGVAMLPADLHEMLAAKVDSEGILPVWTQWWNDEDVAVLFPDPALRARVEAQQRRLPLSYFEDVVPARAGWAWGLPCAYLAFGDTYRSDVEIARGLGWPVHVLQGEHLEMVVHPQTVARAILSLLQEAKAV